MKAAARRPGAVAAAAAAEYMRGGSGGAAVSAAPLLLLLLLCAAHRAAGLSGDARALLAAPAVVVFTPEDVRAINRLDMEFFGLADSPECAMWKVRRPGGGGGAAVSAAAWKEESMAMVDWVSCDAQEGQRERLCQQREGFVPSRRTGNLRGTARSMASSRAATRRRAGARGGGGGAA